MIAGKIKNDISEVEAKCKEDPKKGNGVYIDENNQAWLLGIIDPLNPWDIEKIAEYYIKKPRHGHNMSCVPPKAYKERFVAFMSNGFVYGKDIENKD